nr:zinc finger, CCHC-type [Tanacetum cinerariifolium]
RGTEATKIVVRYENLSVERCVFAGHKAHPFLYNVTFNAIEVVGCQILQVVSEPGSWVRWLTRIDQEEVFVVSFFWKEHEGSILFGLLGSRQQKFLVLRFFDVKEQQGINSKVAQRRLEDKKPEEKTNTDCFVKEQEKEYQTGWKIKTGNVLDSYNQRSTQQCMKSVVAKHLCVTGIQQQNGLVDETNVTLFAKQRMFEPVKVKCIFMGYYKSIVGNKLWRLDDVTSKAVLYKNMSFNKSGEYKKTFISSGVGAGSMQVLHGFEFEVEPLGDHTFEVEPLENVDQKAGLQEVQTQDLMDYKLARDREQHLACELFRYREDSNEAAFTVAAVEKIYAHESLTFNNIVACEVISKWKAGLKDVSLTVLVKLASFT